MEGVTFTVDWFLYHISIWEEKVLPKLKSVENPSYLEIGSYEGRSLLWMLDSVPNLHATSIDPHEEGSRDAFLSNISSRDNLEVWMESSRTVLPRLQGQYDVIYIDGSHWAHDVLTDTILSWMLLKSGGILIWDDYGWLVGDDPIKGPKAAIDAFLTCYRTQYKVLHIGYQFMVEKV